MTGERGRPAVGTFPYPHRTLAEIYRDERAACLNCKMGWRCRKPHTCF